MLGEGRPGTAKIFLPGKERRIVMRSEVEHILDEKKVPLPPSSVERVMEEQP